MWVGVLSAQIIEHVQNLSSYSSSSTSPPLPFSSSSDIFNVFLQLASQTPSAIELTKQVMSQGNVQCRCKQYYMPNTNSHCVHNSVLFQLVVLAIS